MDIEKLIKGKSVSEVEAICENWYSRLNGLKEKNSPKSIPLILIMIYRLTIISRIYIKMSTPLPKYPNGGITDSPAFVGERGEEIIYHSNFK